MFFCGFISGSIRRLNWQWFWFKMSQKTGPQIKVSSDRLVFELLRTRGFISNYQLFNYKELGIKYITPKNEYYHIFFSAKHKFWVCKRNFLTRRFFYAPKTYVLIDRF